ncbi:MAG: HlyC/CorC family transporter [Alphaproteobacteria bacterium]|nr:CNNM domain-containing protein [Candidatus Jidaibacter sp.]
MTSIIIIALVALSGVFALVEAAVLSVSPVAIRKLCNDGDKKALTLEALRENKERFIGTILLCNNVVNIASSALATDLAIQFFGDGGIAIFIATAVMTFLIVIYSDILPKTYAVRNAEFVALNLAWTFTQLIKIMNPIMYVVDKYINKTLELLRISHRRGFDISALESIRSTIDMHHKEGEVRTDIKYMMGAIIDLQDMDVDEIMVHKNNMYSICMDQPIDDIIELFVSSQYSRIPIWEGDIDHIIGVVHIRDLNHLFFKHGGLNVTKEDIKSIVREPWFIPDSTSLKTQLKNFRDKHYHFALIVDEYGELQGLVTLEDILEEVVGQIDDEHDKNSASIIKVSKTGAIIVSGETSLRDINREMDWNIIGGDITTIGGLLFHIAQQVPEVGEEFVWGNYSLRLMKRQNNQILKVRVKHI